MRHKCILITLFLISLILTCCKSAKLTDADEKFKIGEYYDAAAIYRRVYIKTDPRERTKRGYVAFQIGESFRKLNSSARAYAGYQNAQRYNYPDSILYLFLAQAEHEQGKYLAAIKRYNEYLKTHPNDSLAIAGLEGATKAAAWKASPTKYTVKKFELFNSSRGEFSPMINGTEFDQIYFASSRTKDKDAEISPITGQVKNNFFVAKKDKEGVWQRPEEIEDPINTEFDEGTPSFTADGNTMYYTYCEQSPEGPRVAEIYKSTRSGAKWGKGSRVEIVKDSVTTLAHPSVSPDGKYLYFTSDVVGGRGGKDLFRSRITSNGFGSMENLGADINTAGDEVFPYVRDSATIYFASDGHPGMGGLDLFKATLDSTGRWNVVNMRSPINSMADDFGITFEGTKESGYFSSNRNDARGFDHIYSFDYPTVTVRIEGYIMDNEEYSIEDATLRIVGKNGLNATVPGKKDGFYEVELTRDMSYVMMASAPGFLNQGFELKTDTAEKNETYIVDFFLSPITKPVVIDNIFYDFDKATLRPESKEALNELIKMLADNPNVTIELRAHTDRKGTDQYNEALAQRRAQSVVDYLIESGIANDRLQAKGYGESIPKIISKKLAKQHPFVNEGDTLREEFILKHTPEQQAALDQINRRTEFKVLSTTYNLF